MNSSFTANSDSLSTLIKQPIGEQKMQADPLSLEQLAGKVGSDAGGALGVLLAYIGDQSGVYRALETNGPIDCEALAKKTGLDA